MMKKWLKFFAAALAPLATFAFSTAHAAYSLNPEVKTATAALLSASNIGLLKYDNPNLSGAPNKDAIVVMSFGSTRREAREKSIDATVAAIKKIYPRTKIVTAFTSHMIINRIKAKENITYPTPEEALNGLKNEGYTRVALVSLDIIPGLEYDYGVGVFKNYQDQFKKIVCGTSLMYWQGQDEQPDDVTETIKAISGQFPRQQKNEAILLMAHGTPHTSNAYYSVMQAKMEEMGFKDVYVYTVEGWPTLDTVIAKLKANKINSVVLMPAMLVAGDHATNDMAGDADDSHKNILEKAGFKVSVYMHGLGENAAVRNLFVKRTDEAWQALVK